jgi:GAF domain-containing protein
MSDPVLQALLDGLAAATGAAGAWMADTRADVWPVVSAVGPDGAALRTPAWPHGGVVAFVVESDQPAALIPREGVDLTADVEAVLGRRPTAVLVVPCASDTGNLGAVGLVDKAGGGPFSFDDIELASLLGPIAGAALVATRDVDPPSPEELAAALARLRSANPTRYRRVAVAVAALLDGP